MIPPNSRPSSRAWLVVALLWFVACSNFTVRIMVTTMHGSMLAAFPMTETQFGLLTSVFLWTYGSISPIAGFMADRFSRSRVIIICMFVWSVITWLTSYAKTFEQLLVLRAVMGLAEACYIPAALALISDYHGRSTRSLATGIHQTGMAIGVAVGGLGGWLAEQRSWHYAFSVVGLGGIAYCGVLLALLRDHSGDAPDQAAAAVPAQRARLGDALQHLLGRGSFILALAVWVLFGIFGWTVNGWLPVFLQEHFHLTQGAAGLFGTSYSAVIGATGMLAGGALADRWGRRNIRARMIVPALGLLVAAPCLLVTAHASIFVLVIGAIIGLRFFGGFLDSNMMPILCEIVDRRYRATGYGLLNMAGVIAGGVGVYAAGAFRDRSIDLSVVFDLIVVAMVLCAALLYCIRLPTSGSPTHGSPTPGQERDAFGQPGAPAPAPSADGS